MYVFSSDLSTIQFVGSCYNQHVLSWTMGVSLLEELACSDEGCKLVTVRSCGRHRLVEVLHDLVSQS